MRERSRTRCARICIEAGVFDVAEKWFRTGRGAGLQEPNISRRGAILGVPDETRSHVWRSGGHAAEAQRHMDTAKAILDKGTYPDQAIFFLYLTGYVALYGGNYKAAVSELQRANQRDPFILCLMGQAYEKLGDTASAKDVYTRALSASNAHNPPAAYARPFAKMRLADLK